MSRIRANKITNKAGTGAVELEKGAHLPTGIGITGAGSINVSGVITATTFSGNGAALTGIDATALKDPGGNVKIQAQASGAVYTGIHTFTTLNATTLNPTTVNATSLNATSGSFTGNVSIGGTLTYEDVVNVDSVGLVTAREGIFIPDSKEIKLGNTAGSPDMKIHHDGFNSRIAETGTGHLILTSDGAGILLQSSSGQNLAKFFTGDASELYFNYNKKLETSNTGITVTGTVAATSFTGDGSQLTNVGFTTEALTTAGATVTIDLSKDEHKITKSGTYTITCTGGSEGSSHTLRIVNSGTSNVSFSNYFLFPSGGTPALPTASGAISMISFTVHRAGAVGINTQLLAGASVNFS